MTLRLLAREAFGRDDGPSVRRVRQALDDLASSASRVLFYDGVTRTFIREVTTILSWQLMTTLPAHAKRSTPHRDTARVAWTVPIRDQLLAGNYQRLPIAIVRGTSGAALRTWVAVLTRPRAAKLRVRQWADFAVTGDDASIPLQRLGLEGLNRPSKQRDSLDHICTTGNQLQNTWHLEVLERAGGGLKLRLTKLKQPRHFEDAAAFDQARRVRSAKDAAPNESASADGFQETINKTAPVYANTGASTSLPESLLKVSVRIETVRTPYGRVTLDPSFYEDESVYGRTRTIGVKLMLVYGRNELRTLTESQWFLVHGIETRGSDGGCALEDHYAIIDEAAAVVRPDRDTGWTAAGYERDDPLSMLKIHDEEVHPRFD